MLKDWDPSERVFFMVNNLLYITKIFKKGGGNYLQLLLGDSVQVLDNLLHTSLGICHIFAYSQLSPEQMNALSCLPWRFCTRGF